MNNKDLITALIESSSLREDLLKLVGGTIVDLLDNLELTDEVLARVNNDTYEFIKGYKEETI